ncbi:alpha-mannosidase 2x-like [Babylonia areolata]|uniref:alpha-mannosidase 2x-like n=1 Tax=Babylonia areolata TaxID=304850 RepID=UPI003FD01D82
MKRYMVLWGALFFLVMFTSLYLMMETVTNQAPGFAKTQVMENIEMKIHKMEKDLDKNREFISDIKNWVGLLAKGDDKALGHLVELVNDKGKQKEKGVEHMAVNDQGQRPPPGQGQLEVRGEGQEEPKAADTGQQQQQQQAGGEIYEVPAIEQVPVQGATCTLASHPQITADINMQQVVDSLPFDNPDGGAWKQGWEVTYDAHQWQDKTLKIFVVPHSHCDPGWIKTFQDYYRQQTRNIFENMVPKLEVDRRRKFIFAEMSFFSTWWDELDAMKRDRVKKLVDSGQLEIVTGGWVMTDEANTHYFAMIDQLLEGHQWLNSTLGVRPKSGWSIDPFGYSSTMAYLLKRTGFENMLIQRVHYSIKKHLARQRSLEFLWRQQWDEDKSTDMFCHMMPFYSYDVPHTCGPDPKVCCQFDFRRLPGGRHNCPWKVPPVPISNKNVADRALTLLDQYRKKAQLYKTNVVLAPLGDDFRYDKPDEWDLQYGNYQKLFDYINSHPELGAQGQFGTLSDYFAAVHEDVGPAPSFFPSLSGDFFTYSDRNDHYWSGYFTSRPFHKYLDRVLEANLRSAEVIFTLAQAYARRHTASNFPSVEMMKKLVIARRSLGLFQHHDGITGTAKDFVVNDYGKRMLEGLTGAKQVMAESAAFLAAKNKAAYKYNANSPTLDLDEVRDSHDSLPHKPVIHLSDQPTPLVIYNSLGHRRSQVVTVWVSHASVEVRDPQGNVVHSQTELHWDPKVQTQPDNRKYKVVFVADVEPLGLATYTLKAADRGQNSRNHLASTTFLHAPGVARHDLFSVRSETGHEDFTIKNSVLEAAFSGTTGMLKSVKTLATGQVTRMDLQFVLYGTTKARDKSGAYLFLPDGTGEVVNGKKQQIRITRGPIVSEVRVFTPYVEHVVRLINTPGVDGLSLDMHNIVDIRSLNNREISLRINTDISNPERVFYTDLNGFQMQRRQTYDKLPLQANVYPMPAAMFLQDPSTRFSVLSAQALGVFLMQPGQVDIMLDRRLNQDDGRGLEQGVLDNRLTPNHFRLMLEKRHSPAQSSSPAVAYLSLQSHLASLQLTQPLFAMPLHHPHPDPPAVAPAPSSSSFLPVVAPLARPLPCELHLVNLRTLQNRDDDPNLKYVPKESAALLLHHLASDCGFPLYGASCQVNDGKVLFSEMFTDLKATQTEETTLTLMHKVKAVDPSRQYAIPPMEIKTFKTTLL